MNETQNMRRIYVFDTTLRDGEQSPGCTMNLRDKLLVAEHLEALRVDVIEAGFAIASPGDFESVKAIGGVVKNAAVASLCRALPKDIECAWEAVRGAAHPRIHTFIATSPIHMEFKLKMTPDEVCEQAVAMVKYARNLCGDVEFSLEDCSRSERPFIYRVVEGVIAAGATTVNIPDTVGYAVPEQFGQLIADIRQHVPNIAQARLSVHCHNDLGLAVANSLAAVHAGADQVECTVNGIGERAGNTSLEEIAMIFTVRKDLYKGLYTGIDTTQIFPTSRLVSHVTGIPVQPNKAVVGSNAFAHEAGIHQDGYLKEHSTYEIMTPETVGLGMSQLVLGKHSGKHALGERLESLGYHLNDKDLKKVFKRFKEIADKKKEIFDADIEAIVIEEIYRVPDKYELKHLNVTSGTVAVPTATVHLMVEGKLVRQAGFGNGPVDALFKTIISMTGFAAELRRFVVSSITGGTDAQGEVTVELMDKGMTAVGQGSDPDILVASAKALINAMNRIEFLRNKKSGELPNL